MVARKGAEFLFVTPSGDVFADPGTYTLMGYLMLFHEIGLDYTFSAYASEGGNFGLFSSHRLMKQLNAKIYAEARRLGVKWILGGECGHMWRVLHQYMDTMNGPQAGSGTKATHSATPSRARAAPGPRRSRSRIVVWPRQKRNRKPPASARAGAAQDPGDIGAGRLAMIAKMPLQFRFDGPEFTNPGALKPCRWAIP